MGKKEAPKRRVPVDGSSPAKKRRGVPDASALGEVFKRGARQSQKDSCGPVKIVIMKYNENGSIYNAKFDSGPLAVVHFVHEARPSVTFQLIRNLEEYLKIRHEEDDTFPVDRASFEDTFSTRMVMTSGNPNDADEHDLYVPWRVAFYLSMDCEVVKDLLLFLDAYVAWRCGDGNKGERLPSKQELSIEVVADLELELSAEEMDCSYTMITKQANDSFSYKLTDIPPPLYPPKMLCANIEGCSKSTISIVWSGGLYAHRHLFGEAEIGGKEIDKEFFRKAENIGIVGDDMQKALWYFTLALIAGSLVLVRLRNLPENDDALQLLVKEIRKIQNIFVL